MMPTKAPKFYVAGFVVFFSLIGMNHTNAGLVAYGSADIGALSLSAMPNSVAASIAWTSAAGMLGAIHSVDFESSYPTGSQVSLLIAPGVTLSTNVGDFTISNNTSSQFVYSFNTTPGGGFYAGLCSTAAGGGSCFPVAFPPFQWPVYTFSFSNPIQAFGLYITGRGQTGVFGTREIFFNDPLPQSGVLPITVVSRATGQFVGFTDAGAAISSVSITPGLSAFPNLADTFAFDDVRWVSIPEPSTLSLLAATTFALAVSVLISKAWVRLQRRMKLCLTAKRRGTSNFSTLA